jgi:N-acetylneuraminic acid mutarotase
MLLFLYHYSLAMAYILLTLLIRAGPMSPLGIESEAMRHTARRSLRMLAQYVVIGGLAGLMACQGPAEVIYVTPRPATPVAPRQTAPPQPTLAPLSEVPGRYSHTATLLDDGKVLVVGGKDNSGPLGTTEVYDPLTHSWSSAGTLAAARYAHTATLLPSGKVLVAGGRDSDTSALAAAELYDPTTNSWAPAGTLASARAQHTAVLLQNGKVLVAGGYNPTRLLDTAELYDPAENDWTAAAAMHHIYSSGHTASLLPDGQVLIVGGFGTQTQAAVEQYDPATNRWTSARSLADGRVGHTASLLTDGKLLVAGGANSARGGTYLAAAELFDAPANNWGGVAAMTHSRSGQTAVLLPDGQVLVAGGRDASGPLPATERYDPAGNRWAPAGSLAEARWLHTATLLPSGRVLVIGGRDTNGTPLASTEQYSPTTNSWETMR